MAATSIPIRDAIQDLVKNVTSTGFFEKVKLSTDKKGTRIEAVDANKEVILKGRTLLPVEGWDGEFGLANLALLTAISNDPEFAYKESKLELITRADDTGKDVPTEMHYTNRSETFVAYRFVSKNLVPNQPTYNEPSWDVEMKPTKSAIQQFNWAASSLGSYHQHFMPKTVDGNLKFFIGEQDAATQRGGIVFAQNVKGTFDTNFKWPISFLSTLLKLVDGTDAEVKLSAKGAFQITLNTGIAEYKYILPAKVI